MNTRNNLVAANCIKVCLFVTVVVAAAVATTTATAAGGSGSYSSSCSSCSSSSSSSLFNQLSFQRSLQVRPDRPRFSK